jgi:hypothetical protein
MDINQTGILQIMLPAATYLLKDFCLFFEFRCGMGLCAVTMAQEATGPVAQYPQAVVARAGRPRGHTIPKTSEQKRHLPIRA